MPPITCCILGATGFIGGQIARTAVAHGWRVRGVYTSRTRRELGLAEPIPFEQTCRDTLAWFHEHDYLKNTH